MKCPNCNAEIADKSKFCSKCGTKIEPVSQVETPKPEEMTKCIKCGAELKVGAKFCAKCGSSQVEESEPKAESKPEPKAESKPEPKAEPEPEPKAEPKPVPKAIPPMPSQPWKKEEPTPDPIPEKKTKKAPVGLIAVIVVVLVAVMAGIFFVGKEKGGSAEESKIAGSVPSSQPLSTEAESKTEESLPETSEAATQSSSVESVESSHELNDPNRPKGDPALLASVDAKVAEAENLYNSSSYIDAITQGKEAIAEYRSIAAENNLREEAQGKIQAAFQTISKAAVTYCTSIEDQEMGNAGFNEVRNNVQPIMTLLNSLTDEGYSIDASELTTYYDGVIPRFRDYYIRKINEITEREQWSRDEAWTYAHQAYSIQDNGEVLLFDEYDLEDPLQMRFVYCRGWIYRKRCENGLSDGSMTQEDAFNYMIQVLQETDYNLLVLDDLITYGKAAGKDVKKYQDAFDAIVEELQKEQGLVVINNGGVNQGTSIDIRKFWYFNDLDGDEKYKVDENNGTTKATREWIRKNIPEYFK